MLNVVFENQLIQFKLFNKKLKRNYKKQVIELELCAFGILDKIQLFDLDHVSNVQVLSRPSIFRHRSQTFVTFRASTMS